MRLLDYGCGRGDLLEALTVALPGIDAYGCELDPEFVASAQQRLGRRARIFAIEPGVLRLPFDDATVDAVALCDVLEHLGARLEDQVLAELRRVLRPGGQLVLTVPQAGSFAWADLENLKFRAPRVHRAAYRLMRGRTAYVHNYSGGRIGNFSAGAGWHRHYRVAELETLLFDHGLVIEAITQYGLLDPVILGALKASEVFDGAVAGRQTALTRALWRSWFGDLRRDAGNRSSNVGLRARAS